jgi:hypothetical protein
VSEEEIYKKGARDERRRIEAAILSVDPVEWALAGLGAVELALQIVNGIYRPTDKIEEARARLAALEALDQ